MTLSISSNLRESFDFAKDGLIGYWGRWVALIIICLIPIVNFISYGYSVKIYRGVSHAPDLDDIGAMFIDGLKIFIIELVYMIIPLILIFAPLLYFMESLNMVGIAIILIGTILAIVLSLLSIIGSIRFAKTNSLGEAFNFGEITAKIGEIGWGSYILATLAFIILAALIIGILSAIPYVGTLLPLIITPLFLLWQAKYFENIYSLA